MRRIRIPLFAFLSSWLFLQQGAGQNFSALFNSQRVHFERYSVEQGYYGWRTYGAVQDAQGYIWIATRYGLHRYDGYTFVNWSERSDSVVVHTTWTGAGFIEIDRQGDLWFGEREGLERFDPLTYRVTHYRHDPGDETSISSDTVFAFIQDLAGRYWVGTAAGLDRFDPESGDFRSVRPRPGDPEGLPPGRVDALLEDRNGYIWVGCSVQEPTWMSLSPGGSRSVLGRMEGSSETFRRYPLVNARTGKTPNGPISALTEDRNGRIWIGAWGADGLYRYDPALDRILHFPYDPANPERLSSPHQQDSLLLYDDPMGPGVQFVFEDSEGILWIGGFLGGNSSMKRRPPSLWSRIRGKAFRPRNCP